MIAIRYDESQIDRSKEFGNENANDKSGKKKITEIYTTRIPKLLCFKRAFARDLIEMDFCEDFEVDDYDSEKEIGKRKKKVCYYKGHFIFSLDVEVSIYEAKNFARIYLTYDASTEESEVEEVRQRLIKDGLERRIINKTP